MTSETILVAANSSMACTVFTYALATGSISPTIFRAHTRCSGIAMDSDTVYVTLLNEETRQAELTFWVERDPKRRKGLPLAYFQSIGAVLADSPGRRILVADPIDEKLFSVSTQDQKLRIMARGVGEVKALGFSRDDILIGLDRTVGFLSRKDGVRRNPPREVQTLNVKNLCGLAVDEEGRLWVADKDRHVIVGPIRLND